MIQDAHSMNIRSNSHTILFSQFQVKERGKEGGKKKAFTLQVERKKQTNKHEKAKSFVLILGLGRVEISVLPMD